MNFATWEPLYAAILADFGYDRRADEEARDYLATKTTSFDLARLALAGKTVAIAGGGPSLSDEFAMVRTADAVIAASGAAALLRDAGFSITAMTTDLDKTPETACRLAAVGIPVVIHAHGDNQGLLREILPTIRREAVLPTTQAEPVGPVRNFGGFTDGDRAAFLADALGAERLVFPGWDFEDESVSPEKRRKLRWAAWLLRRLEATRGDRFRVLDGYRSAIASPITRSWEISPRSRRQRDE